MSEELGKHPLTPWLEKRGWQWFPHQIAALEVAYGQRRDVLVLAPTGGGKTLTGFLPSFLDLFQQPSRGQLHTLYVSPLKALAVDVQRNVGRPIEELGLPVTFETRTGDTSSAQRRRQRTRPPDWLMTTPESLALMLSYEDARAMFRHLRYVIVDELHAFMHSKRADLLSLNLERLRTFAPKARRIGLSATVADKKLAQAWICRRGGRLVEADASLPPKIEILPTSDEIPWSGHSGAFAVEKMARELRRAQSSVVFVNTRSQAELIYQLLVQADGDKLALGVHHGSLEKAERLQVEKAMAAGQLQGVVATASLDLGMDWAEVDLVMQVGAPKGVSRLLQRVGRSNHRLDQASRAFLVPTNRLEYIECVAAIEEIARGRLDGVEPKRGGLDVLAQHLVATACHGPFQPSRLYKEIRRAWPYRQLSESDFMDCLALVNDGGYALQAYERFSRLVAEDRGEEEPWYRLRHPREARRYRMNVGTIVEAPMLQIRAGTRRLGKIEESFIERLTPGQTFLFAGKVWSVERVRGTEVQVKRSRSRRAEIPIYAGGKLPLSTKLAHAVRVLLGRPALRKGLPRPVREWLELQEQQSLLPNEKTLVVESFPHRDKEYLVAYTFAGYHANQTLGFLCLRRMKRLGLRPLGFVMSDYAVALWSLRRVEHPRALFHSSLLEESFDEWLLDTPMIKRLFREAAVVSGLIERKQPGHTRSGRQVRMSTDLIYDVLRNYDPNHVLLRAAQEEARSRLIERDRVEAILTEAQNHLEHRSLERVSPLAVPTLLQINAEMLSREDRAEAILEAMEAEIFQAAGMDRGES